jgi:hypothetical protein
MMWNQPVKRINNRRFQASTSKGPVVLFSN